MKTRGVIALVFVLWIALALGRTVPDAIDRPLLRDAQGAREAVPLPVTVSDGRQVQRSLILHTSDPGELSAYDELRLVIGTYDTAPALAWGTVTLDGTCVFRAARERLGDNTPIAFHRETRCPALPHAPATVSLVLAFDAASPRDARAALWMIVLPSGTAPLLRTEVEGRAFGALGRGLSERSATRVTRAALLAFMWDLSPIWIWTFLAGAGSLAIAGAIAIDRARLAAAVMSSFALAAGVALCYAVTVPPLQAPDEPDHLLSFAKLTARPALAEATSVWAKRIHFHRLTFMPDERFTPADRERPYHRDWPPEVFAENVRDRSSTATQFWQALAPIVPANPPHALLLFRCAQGLAFGAAFAAGAAMIGRGGGLASPALLAAVLLMIPTLPFFGMQLSELTFTLAAFILTGYAAMMLLSGASGRVTGPVLGLAVALIAGGPRSGWPALAILAALAAGRAWSAASEPKGSFADTAWFWTGVALPGVVLFGTRLLWIPSPFYEQWHLSTFDPRAGISSATFLLVLCGGALLGAAAEWLLRRAIPLINVAATVARVACVVGAVTIVVTLAWSVGWSLPSLQNVETVNYRSAAAYVQAVLLPLATAARVRGFDFLTWTSLWGGFGWADAILPAPAIAVVTVIAAAAAIGALVMAARDATGRRAVITVCGIAGLALSAAVAAVSSYGLHRNVHGRYLLGACIVGLCLLAAPALLAQGKRIPAAVRAAALLALACGLHAFALVFLLEKYFG